MRAFHDSRDSEYRFPYGVAAPGSPVTLAIDVFDASVANVTLRTWVDGAGEALYPMTPTSPTHFEVELKPGESGIVWYHFIITADDGSQKRYGAVEGRRGGEGALYDWEPPSFQLTVCDEGAQDVEKLEEQAIGGSLSDALASLMSGQMNAREFVERYETLRENCPEDCFVEAIDLIGTDERLKLLAQLGGVPVDGELAEDAKVTDVLEGGQIGLAKGRLWCASLIQLLAAGLPEGGQVAAQDPYDRAATLWGAEDPDCEAIVRNASELRLALPSLAQGVLPIFAVNDDVIGIWGYEDDGATVCVLVNASLYNAHDVPVPMVDEYASEIISGYGMPIVDAAEAGDVPAAFADAERYARVHLYQLGSAILYFHGDTRLERPMQDGVGVLAHITSLPANAGKKGLGTLGDSARAFVDWLADAGVRYWQILPVNPTDDHGSPYAGISAFAGNVQLLEEFPDFEDCKIDKAEYERFCKREADWLEPYVSFMAIREKVGAGKVWQAWPKKYRTFDAKVIAADAKLSASAERWRLGQFVFEQRWKELCAYANERGVQIVGDMPIYVSSDSSDVWANPGIFQLGKDGRPEMVAGCPPDRFAVEGQIWGNPVYNWDALAADGYTWWLRRLERAFDLYDVVRLDHFIGFARYFSIPAGEKATAGAYRPGPGIDLFRRAYDKFGPLPVIAEDLGSITPSVRALVATCGFPGMDIMQFVDGNDPLSGYQPRPDKIAYTGTHDNQTIVGYCAERYPHLDALEAADDLIEKLMTCNAAVCVVPLQDVLGLDDDARMNEPGTVEGNWIWQADAADIEDARDKMKRLVELHENR